MSVDWEQVCRQFLLTPDEIYLNAGTFSAIPRPVYEALIGHVAEGEANPTRVAAWRRRDPMWQAQVAIARYVGADPDDILFHVNVTHALNQALFCLPWPHEGEFVISDLEYGAIANAAREVARRHGLDVRVLELPRRPSSPQELADSIIGGLSPRTVGILLSHVTSGTGMLIPVERIAPELRRRGVRLIVDGAHGPGLVPLRLGETEIDAYGGNLHKWFMGPKGTAFLYVARRLHAEMRPHVVGWGGATQDAERFRLHETGGAARPFQHVFQLQGLIDASPFLALHAVLEYRNALGEQNILRRIAELVDHARARLGGDLGLEILSPPPAMNVGLVSFHVPGDFPGHALSDLLYSRFRITVPAWQREPGAASLRVSPHIWNTPEHIDRLADALRQLTDRPSRPA